jgi:hypothetical protein
MAFQPMPLFTQTCAFRVVNVTDLWQTVAMTTQETKKVTSQHREDYKVEKLMRRIETKMALQAKAVREAERTTSKQ